MRNSAPADCANNEISWGTPPAQAASAPAPGPAQTATPTPPQAGRAELPPADCPIDRGTTLSTSRWRQPAGTRHSSPEPVPDRPTSKSRAGAQPLTGTPDVAEFGILP